MDTFASWSGVYQFGISVGLSQISILPLYSFEPQLQSKYNHDQAKSNNCTYCRCYVN